MSIEIKLKKCPFCGGKAKFSKTSVYWVQCKDCDAETINGDNGSKEAAAENWNKRFNEKELKAYQVGDNDVVAAYDEEGAIKVLGEYCGFSEMDYEDFDNGSVEDLTSKLNVMLKDEEGNDLETLGDWMKRIDEPEYLYGWE